VSWLDTIGRRRPPLHLCAFVRPCIPTTAEAIPRGDAWLHEPKLDGYRFSIVKDGRQVKLYSWSGYDLLRCFVAEQQHAAIKAGLVIGSKSISWTI
jgi:ATP-dependent DNA ligase